MASLSDQVFGNVSNKKIVVRASASRMNIIKIEKIDFPAKTIATRVVRAINNATPAVAAALKEALDAAIRAGVWQWDDTIRDIYDTGELMDSGQVIIDGNGIKIIYDAPYAMLVHYGGYISPYGRMTEKVYLPPRPWIEATLLGNGPVPKFDYIRFYRKAIEVEFRK